MVHALHESWRVLSSGGKLVDLRPYPSGWPIEIVTGKKEIILGRLDDSLSSQDDIEANSALSVALQRGWFVKEEEASFEYTYYWESVGELIEYLEAEWYTVAIIPEDLLSEAQNLLSEFASAEIRIKRSMRITSYQKQN